MGEGRPGFGEHVREHDRRADCGVQHGHAVEEGRPGAGERRRGYKTVTVTFTLF